MTTLDTAVRALLESTGAAVWYNYPASWVTLPSISWKESECRELAQADGREHLTELEYTVDIWSKSPEELHDLARTVDGRMTSIRLRRDRTQELFDSTLQMHHRWARYRCVSDQDGNIYQ